jgi:glycerol-3-phosphate acyltransferase PlsX
LGLRGIVVKSHGGADNIAFNNAIGVAVKEARSGVLNRISQQLEIEHIRPNAVTSEHITIETLETHA